MTVQLTLCQSSFRQLPRTILPSIILRTVRITSNMGLTVIQIQSSVATQGRRRLRLLPHQNSHLTLNVRRTIRRSDTRYFASFNNDNVRPLTKWSAQLL